MTRRAMQGLATGVVTALCVALAPAASGAPGNLAVTCTGPPRVTSTGPTGPFTATLTGAGKAKAAVAWTFDSDLPVPDLGPSFSFTVAHPVVPGLHTVKVSALTTNGASASDNCTVIVNAPPVASLTHSSATPLPGSVVPFGSTATDPDMGPVDPLALTWTTNSGLTGAGATFKPQVGTAPVTVTLLANDGLESDTASATITPASGATATASYLTPAPGQSVTFIAGPQGGVGDAFRYYWDFGDQSSAVGQFVTHTFAPGVSRTVTLRVTDSYGGSSFATLVVRPLAAPGAPPPPPPTRPPVRAPNRAPLPGFKVLPAVPRAGQAVLLTSTSRDLDGRLVLQQWDLDGDGRFHNGSGRYVRHVFPRAGRYSIGLRVVDDRGAARVARRTVRVIPAPLRLMTPFPRVRLAGVMVGAVAHVRVLSVRAPRGAAVRVGCRGRSCPVRGATRRSRGRLLRFSAFERALPAGVVLAVRVTKPATIGRYVAIRLRRGRAPARLDRCLRPSSSRPVRCP